MTFRHRLGLAARTHTVRVRVAQMAVISPVLLGVVLAREPQSLTAQRADPTFAEDVAPILYKNCTSCHHPGGMGPFSLLDFASAKAKVSEMREVVAGEQMPPWHAEGAHGVFRNDRRLSDADKLTILRWIDAGAKPGDLKKLPPTPEYPESWTIGKPDAVVTMTEDFVVPASGTVEYQYFDVPTKFTEDKWIEAMEIMPGAREVVHHVMMYANVPPAPGVAPSTPAPRPVGTPAPAPLFIRNATHGPPEDSSCSTCSRSSLGTLIGTATPGNNVVEFPKGTALLLRAGTVLKFNMHYTAHGHEMKDRTKIGFRFAKEMPEEQIYASNFANGSFVIPAGAKDVAVPAEIGVREPVRIWGLMPHTHVRGTRWQYKLEKPDGTSEIILDVPHYDFNWQTYYMFDKPLEIPAGGRITSMAWYDNSKSNLYNPDANKVVKWGDQTWEEMQYTGFLYSVPSRRLKPAGGSR